MDVKIRLLKISVINLGELMFEFSLAWVNPLSFLGKWIKFHAISCVGDFLDESSQLKACLLIKARDSELSWALQAHLAQSLRLTRQRVPQIHIKSWFKWFICSYLGKG